MEIQGVTGNLDPVKSQRGRGVRRDPAKPVSSSDTVEISTQAQELKQVQADIQRVREITDRLPEVRDERVTQVRERVQSGYYNRDDVKSSIVDELINLFG